MKTPKGFTISAPGLDKSGFASGDVGLSAAINYAQRLDATVYVRDPDGDTYGYVEPVEGIYYVHRVKEATR